MGDGDVGAEAWMVMCAVRKVAGVCFGFGSDRVDEKRNSHVDASVLVAFHPRNHVIEACFRCIKHTITQTTIQASSISIVQVLIQSVVLNLLIPVVRDSLIPPSRPKPDNLESKEQPPSLSSEHSKQTGKQPPLAKRPKL